MPVAPPQGPAPAPGMLWSANDYIAGALRLINSYAPGESLDDDDAATGITALNQMLDSWNSERLSVFTVQRLGPFNLTPAKQAYTVGLGGDINIARPPRIERYGIIVLNDPTQPIELPLEDINESNWLAIPVKQILSAIPLQVWDDGQFPLRTLNLWPIPSIVSQITLYSWQQLAQFTDPAAQLEFPPGYARAIRFNLAVELAPEYGKDAPASVAAIALESKAKIKSFNIPIIYSSIDPALSASTGNFDWRSDSPITRS